MALFFIYTLLAAFVFGVVWFFYAFFTGASKKNALLTIAISAIIILVLFFIFIGALVNHEENHDSSVFSATEISQ